MSKKMIIKGVGTFMAKRLNKDGGTEVVTLGTLQSLRIDLNIEMEDVFGGDGLFAIDNLVSSKSIEIVATDAKFDLGAVQLVMGSGIEHGVMSTLWVLGEQAAAVAGENGGTSVAIVNPVFAVDLPANPEFAVRVKDSNTLLTQVPFVTATAPTAGKFMVSPLGGLILPVALVGTDMVFNYKRESEVDVVNILTDEVPFPVHVVHHGSFLQKDGTFQGIETELYACLARGTFSIDAQRATASASAVTLQVIDPERSDNKLGSLKRYTSPTRI